MSTATRQSKSASKAVVHWDQGGTERTRILPCKGQPVRRFQCSSDTALVTCKTCAKMINARLAPGAAVDRIKADPRVKSTSNERGMGEGVWVYLKPGYISGSTDTGSIHESTWAEAERVLRRDTREVRS